MLDREKMKKFPKDEIFMNREAGYVSAHQGITHCIIYIPAFL